MNSTEQNLVMHRVFVELEIPGGDQDETDEIVEHSESESGLIEGVIFAVYNTEDGPMILLREEKTAVVHIVPMMAIALLDPTEDQVKAYLSDDGKVVEIGVSE